MERATSNSVAGSDLLDGSPDGDDVRIFRGPYPSGERDTEDTRRWYAALGQDSARSEEEPAAMMAGYGTARVQLRLGTFGRFIVVVLPAGDALEIAEALADLARRQGGTRRGH